MPQTSYADRLERRPSTPLPYSPEPRGAKRILFGGAPTDSPALDWGLLLLRVIAGLALAYAHGLGKFPPSEGFVTRVGTMGLPAPELFSWLAATAELGGGVLLALGLLTRPAALLVLGNMSVVVLLAHAGDSFGDREKAVLFGAVALFYLLVGAGRYSLDALIRRRDG